MKRLGTLSEDERLRLLEEASSQPFGHNKGHDHEQEWDYWATSTGNRLWVKICPGGRLRRHHDGGLRLQHVLQTNDRAISYVDGVGYNLEQGGIYELDASKDHWSENDGDTDRIHYVEILR